MATGPALAGALVDSLWIIVVFAVAIIAVWAAMDSPSLGQSMTLVVFIATPILHQDLTEVKPSNRQGAKLCRKGPEAES